MSEDVEARRYNKEVEQGMQCSYPSWLAQQSGPVLGEPEVVETVWKKIDGTASTSIIHDTPPYPEYY